jgi:hypothetical protein
VRLNAPAESRKDKKDKRRTKEGQKKDKRRTKEGQKKDKRRTKEGQKKDKRRTMANNGISTIVQATSTFAEATRATLAEWVAADADARAEGTRTCDNAMMMASLRENLGVGDGRNDAFDALAVIVSEHSARAQVVIDSAAALHARIVDAKAQCALALEHLLRIFLDIERGSHRGGAENERDHETAAAGVLAASVAGHLYHAVANLQIRPQPPIAGVTIGEDNRRAVGDDFIGSEASATPLPDLNGLDGDTVCSVNGGGLGV